MKKIVINSKTLNNAALWIVAKRSLFLIIFFGAFLVYSFDVIYKNAYLKLEYVDYSNSSMIFDGRKESIMISKITESLRQKDQIIREGLTKTHKNIFVYEEVQDAGDNVVPKTMDNSESPVSESGDSSAVNASGVGDGSTPADPANLDVAPDKAVQ